MVSNSRTSQTTPLPCVRKTPSSFHDDPRVIAAVEEYLRLDEAGQRPSDDAFLATHPEIADLLRPCLAGLRFVQEAAAEIEASSAGIGSQLSAEHMTNEPLGDFQLIREIGRGGMGIVYEAEQRSLRRRVAVKVLPLAAILDKRRLERFQHEAAVAAMLKHPHIVGVYSVGFERGVHFYAMELIEGLTFAEVIADLANVSLDGSDHTSPAATSSETPIAQASPAIRDNSDNRPQAERDTVRLTHSQRYSLRSESKHEFSRAVARLGVQAAEALEYAHSRGVVHRDIKPSNVMVEGQGHVWVTDFGLAHIESESSLTLSGDLIGTLRYMSPEQAEGHPGLVDHRTDIYSLGATLYELATGQPVIKSNERAVILRQIAEQEPTAPHKLTAKCPRDLETIILKSLAKQPIERYATAQQMADDLSRFLDDKPVTARRPGPVRHALKWTRRHRTMVATAAVTFLLSLVISVALIARAYQSERAQRQVAETERAQAKTNLLTAQSNLQLARSAVDGMYTNVATQWLAKETAISELQSSFLEKALEVYQGLTRVVSDDPEEQRSAAVAFERIGEIRIYLLEYERGCQALRKSIDVEEDLLTRVPSKPELFGTLIGRFRKLAEAFQELAMLAEAETAYTQGLVHLDALRERYPEWNSKSDVSAHYQLGRATLLLKQDQPQRAEQLVREAWNGYKQVYSSNDKNYVMSLGWNIANARCGYYLADALYQQQRLPDAETTCRQTFQQCSHHRKFSFHNSRDLIALELRLEEQLGDLAFAQGRLDEAEKTYRKVLEVRRQNFKAGMEPGLLSWTAAMKNELSYSENWEEGPFCDHVETQLRLAKVLTQLSRPYAAERVLGECTRTIQLLFDTRPDVLRYRVARANSWVQTGQLLAAQRPDESKQAFAFAAEVWRETVSMTMFPHAHQYRSGVHGARNDLAWCQEHIPNGITVPENPDGKPLDEPTYDTPFGDHARALVWYSAGDWSEAIGSFQRAARVRTFGQAYDWFYVAMANWQLGQHDAAREWYDKAIESMKQDNRDDIELEELHKQAGELLGK